MSSPSGADSNDNTIGVRQHEAANAAIEELVRMALYPKLRATSVGAISPPDLLAIQYQH